MKYTTQTFNQVLKDLEDFALMANIDPVGAMEFMRGFVSDRDNEIARLQSLIDGHNAKINRGVKGGRLPLEAEELLINDKVEEK